MWRNHRLLDHFPGASAVTVGLVIQRPNRAEIDNIGRKLVIDRIFHEGADLHVFAAIGCTQLLRTLDLFAETHAARAMYAARHIGRDERTNVFVFDDALAIVVSGNVPPVAHREILQLALPALITYRAVQRVIDQQKFHRCFLRSDRTRRASIDLHALYDGRGTRRHRFRRLLDFDQAHTAVRRNAQFFVIAKAGNVATDPIGHLDHHLTLAGLDRLAVDLDVNRVVAHCIQAAASVVCATMLRPRCSTMYSNSC